MKKLIILMLGCIVLIQLVSAFSTNSSSYSSYVDAGSSGGGVLSSDNYSSQTSIGDTIGVSSSPNYNASFGFIPTITGAARTISVSLNYPSDGAAFSSGSVVNFNWTAIGASPVCNLTIDNIINASDITSPNGIAVNYSVLGLADGVHTWRVNCSDSFGNKNGSVTRSFSVSTAIPVPVSPGGGGVSITIKENFSVNPQLLEYQIKKGATITKQIVIKNLVNKGYSISIKQENLSKFVLIKEESLTLKPLEEKTVDIIFYAPESEKADVYFGKIIVTSSYKQEIVSVIAELKERVPLFDIQISVPEISKSVLSCSLVYAKINLKNMGDIMRVDTFLNYAIKDLDGNIINEKSESIAVENATELNRFLGVPCGTSPGKYVVYGRVEYGNQTASAYDSFEVIYLSWIWEVAVGLIILLLIIFIIVIIRRRLQKRLKRKMHLVKRRETLRKIWIDLRKSLTRFLA